MSELVITTHDNRPRNIVIGAVVILVITWWQFTGSLPLLASCIMPDPPSESSDNVRTAYSFIGSIIGDLLYWVGVLAVSVTSGIWSMLVQLVKQLIDWLRAPKDAPKESVPTNLNEQEANWVDSRINAALAIVSAEVARLDAKIDATAVPKPAPVRASRTRTKAK